MLDYLKTTFGLVSVVATVIILLSLAPWLLFWSVETLFGFVIPFTFWNWIAAFVLLGLVRGGK